MSGVVPKKIEEALLKLEWRPSKYQGGVEFVPHNLVYRDVEEFVKAQGTVRLYDRLYFYSRHGYLTRISVYVLAGRNVG